MASCVHPCCVCKQYEDSKSSKSGTLVQFLGCHSCGHKAADHRQLTASDRFIQSELAAAASYGQCLHKIPASEVPHSSVFSCHDPIPLPIDSDCNEPEQESGVQCACSGFQSSDVSIVRLWQRFKGQSIKDISDSLQQVQCSFCRHPLSEHKQSKAATKSSNDASALPSSVTWFRRLSLSATAKLETSIVADGRCFQLLTPRGASDKKVVLAVLKRSDDSCAISLLLYRHTLQSEIKEDVVRSTVGKLTSELSLSQGNNGASSSECVGRQDSISSVHTSGSNDAAAGGAVPSRKRKRDAPNLTQTRKSQRLVNAKKLRIEAASLGNVKELRLNGVPGTAESEEAEYLAALHRDSRLEEETTIAFIKSLQSSPFEKHTLPNELQEPDLRMKMSVCCVGPSNELLVAIGEGKRVFVSLISMETREAEWIRLRYEYPSGTVTCLSWFAPSELASQSEVDCKLCAGTTSGLNVHLWSAKMTPSSNSLVCSQLGYCNNTQSRLAVASWSPNGKLICVGTLKGEVLFYSVEAQATPVLAYVQTVECCNASVRTVAWSEDNCAVAVGGSDDCVQLLQCRKQQCGQTAHTPNQQQQSILKYVRGKQFSHTHTLRGHHSFIADAQFLSSSSRSQTRELVTLGWDGQVLLWTNLAVAATAAVSSSSFFLHGSQSKPSSKHRDHAASRPVCAVVAMEADPQLGFKIGPSVSVEFLPLFLCVVARRGVVLAVGNRLGGISLVCYFSKQQLDIK